MTQGAVMISSVSIVVNHSEENACEEILIIQPGGFRMNENSNQFSF